MISFNVFAINLVSETFNTETGELFWDINKEVRLKYISGCQISNSDKASAVYNIIKSIDLFLQIHYYETMSVVECKERGLRVIYKLRQDGLFPPMYKSITINNKDLNYASTIYPTLRSYYDKDNYQAIYAAIQTKSLVTVKIKERYSRYSSRPFSAKIISILNLDNSDAIKVKILGKAVIAKNNKLREKYKYVIIYNILGLLAVIVLLIIYKLKVHPLAKTILSKSKSTLAAIPNLLHRFKKDNIGIIKSDKMRSYSVADELLKWAELKKNGDVSEEEYNIARNKILKDN